jgi:hypothetical protein
VTRFIRFVAPILSVGLLAAGYFLSGLVWPVVGLLVLGVFWIVGLAFRWDWVPLLGLFAAFGSATLGLFIDISPVFLISASIFALLAWDLAEFHKRLRKGSPEDDLAALEKRHFLRVAALALAGGLLSAFALTLHLKPSFEWMVILMLFAVWGISRMVDWLLKKGS